MRINLAKNFFGSIDKAYIKPFVGQYKTQMKSSDGKFSYGLEFYISENKAGSVQLTTGGVVIQKVSFNNPTLQWTSEDGNPSNGTITLYIVGATNKPGFSGFFWKKGAQKPAANNIFGTCDSEYLEPWSAYYSTSMLPATSGGETEPGPLIQVVGTSSPSSTVVIMYGTIKIKKPQFNNPVLCWSMDDGNVSSAELTLYNQKGRKISGYVWFKKGGKPQKPNIVGFIDPKYLQSWTGTYYTSTKQPDGSYKPDDTKVIIKGGKTEEDSSVEIGKDKVKNWNYSKNQLAWTDADNESNGALNFYISPKDKCQSFSGNYWKKGETKTSGATVIGSTKEPPTRPSSTSQFIKEFIVNLAIGGAQIYIIEKVKKWWGARKKYKENPTDENKKEMDEAEADADEQFDKADEAMENAAEENPGLQPSEPAPVEPTVTI